MSTGKDNLLNAWRTPYGASIFQVRKGALPGGTFYLNPSPPAMLRVGAIAQPISGCPKARLTQNGPESDLLHKAEQECPELIPD